MTSHLNAVKKIFKYLKGQPNLGLWYPRYSPFQLKAYSDSDYAGSHGDRKFTTGRCQFLGRRLISWQCKKQIIVATSSTEAEYVAAASCCGQVLWIQNQMLDYGFNFMNTKIFVDNQSTIRIVKNPVFHQRTKHIEIRHYFIKDANEKNLIQSILGCSIPRHPMLLVVQVFLLVVLVHADGLVPDTTTMPFRRTRTKRRRLRKTFTSSAFEHFQENISAVEDTIPAGDGIPADAQTIPAGSTPIPTTGGVSAGSSMDHAGQAAAAAPSSSVILAA
nr:putative ribonuclease H-like domain-containing protein [Tanacetum cinerariifolium]